MKNKYLVVLSVIVMAVMALAACGSSKDEKLPVSDDAYAEYVGAQFAGQDPWGGELTITVRSIVDGKMDWTFTDSFDDHTLYQEQSGTVIQDGSAEYSIEGKDAENKNVSFSYEGTMDLKEGQITFSFLKGSVTTKSSAGDSDFRMAEALEPSGISNEVVLVKTADDRLTTYVVQSGDSIHSIAKEYGITTKELAILNQTVIIETAKAYGHEFDDVIEYAQYLFPGEELVVPKK
ncbi:MAG: LysM peptidoglycan-binding domain-containing protein [Lachnospiraceae bacterium]|nr:LysM peptidoglycan-binding domain-containing protein [Lachnospiraceae bacterium]